METFGDEESGVNPVRLQRAQDLRFMLEAMKSVGIGRKSGGKNFQGDFVPEVNAMRGRNYSLCDRLFSVSYFLGGNKRRCSASSRQRRQPGAGIRDHRAGRRGQDRAMPTRYCRIRLPARNYLDFDSSVCNPITLRS